MTSMEQAFARIVELIEDGDITDVDDILDFVRSGHENVDKFLEEKYS